MNEPGRFLRQSLRPGAIDIVAGFLIGEDATAPPLPEPMLGGAPVKALQDVLLPLLARPPCLVSFSGGRDSSAILAVAAAVARAEGLPLPVPATYVCPDVAEADEGDWQELVIRHLALSEWHRVIVRDELGAIGPVASVALQRHGLLWPEGTYGAIPLMQAARGGAFLTGLGGDELFGSRGSRLARIRAGECRPRLRDVLALGVALSPPPIRRRIALLRGESSYPWLRPKGRRLVRHAFARWSSTAPGRWDRALDAWWRSRDLQACREAMPLLASDLDVVAVHPFTEPTFVGELRSRGGATGFPHRTAAMRSLFGDVLPEPVLSRATKARFGRSVFGPDAVAFAQNWNGSGIDHELVDIGVLRAMWQTPEPDGRTMLLLQEAWRHRAKAVTFVTDK